MTVSNLVGSHVVPVGLKHFNTIKPYESDVSLHFHQLLTYFLICACPFIRTCQRPYYSFFNFNILFLLFLISLPFCFRSWSYLYLFIILCSHSVYWDSAIYISFFIIFNFFFFGHFFTVNCAIWLAQWWRKVMAWLFSMDYVCFRVFEQSMLWWNRETIVVCSLFPEKYSCSGIVIYSFLVTFVLSRIQILDIAKIFLNYKLGTVDSGATHN